MTDPIVESVRDKLHYRSKLGIRKYGTDMTRTDLTTLDWLHHFQQELMDGCLYVERIIQDMEKMIEQGR
jgi:hypothetical protein